MNIKKIPYSVGGFTLIELMVALGVFIIITTIAVGGFVSALRSQRQVAALISANNNVSLAIEQIAREIRTGRNFCPSSFPPSCPPHQLQFRNAYGELVTYRMPTAGAFIERGDSTGIFKRITGLGAFVWNLNFFVVGEDTLDKWPTRITLTVSVRAKEKGVSEGVIYLQTTVSARQADE